MFTDVLDTGLVTAVNVDTTQSEKLLRLLDTVVIKLEGGTEEDLKVLDEKPIEHRPLEPLKEIPAPVVVVAAAAPAAEPKPASVVNVAKSGDDEEDDVQQPVEAEANDMPKKANDTVEVSASANASATTKRTTSGSSSSSHSSSSSSSSDDDDSRDADEEEHRYVHRNYC